MNPTPDRPFLSVIMPVHQGADLLPRSLEALRASDLPRELWELIVVDDASRDQTAEIAARYADTVLRLPGKRHGPAYARNRGFEVARGECIVFVDADVCVHPDTLRRFAHVLATEPEVSAVFGSYDNRPPSRGIVSQYRNLLHHYVHQQCAGEAETFWAGCGAIRSAVFREAGMYDEWHFSTPQIEDIELGHRVRGRGHRIVLRPDIQGTHLKRWTLRSMVTTDLHNRGVPWMRLLIQVGATLKTKTLNLRTVEKINTAFIGFAFLVLIPAAVTRDTRWLALAILLLLPVLWSNRSLYAFFRRERGLAFAIATIPLHMLYYIVNGLSAAYGWLLHTLVGEPRPDPVTEAYAEVGAKTWPPVPARGKTDTWRAPYSSE